MITSTDREKAFEKKIQYLFVKKRRRKFSASQDPQYNKGDLRKSKTDIILLGKAQMISP